MNLGILTSSLNRILEHEQSSTERAKIQILYFLLIFSIIKSIIALFVSFSVAESTFPVFRAITMIVLYSIFLKILLTDLKYLNKLTHILTISGILVIYSILFISAKHITLISLQFVFMTMLCGVFLFNRKWGTIYILSSILPFIFFLFKDSGAIILIQPTKGEFAWYGLISIIVLNFITFVVSIYLFYEAFIEAIERKEKLNVQLQEALTETEKLARTKSDFLSTMSHELRTPLNIVIGMSRLMQDSQRDKEQNENLNQLSFASEYLYSLINDILDFNKIESGKVELEKVEVKLFDQVSSIFGGMSVLAFEKGLKYSLHIDPRLKNVIVLSDPTRLSQIIYNLLSNAIKFTSEGSVEMFVKEVSRSDNQVNIHFDVRDTGIGIAPEKQATIFDPFIQASSSTSRTHGGTGLGLSIVSRLVSLFGSEIMLESTPGIGTHFSFEVSFEISQHSPKKFSFQQPDEVELISTHILIAEDNSMNIFLMRRILDQWRIKYKIAANGEEAFNMFQLEPVDIILMDLHMPVMDGYEATRQIRKLPNGTSADVKIIALTANSSEDLDVKAKEAGMDDIILKPFTPEELLRKIKAYLK